MVRVGLGGCRVQGADANVVRAAVLRRDSLVYVACRDTNDGGGAQQPTGVGQANVALSYVNAVRPYRRPTNSSPRPTRECNP
jgi:hypothetical protein